MIDDGEIGYIEIYNWQYKFVLYNSIFQYIIYEIYSKIIKLIYKPIKFRV